MCVCVLVYTQYAHASLYIYSNMTVPGKGDRAKSKFRFGALTRIDGGGGNEIQC